MMTPISRTLGLDGVGNFLARAATEPIPSATVMHYGSAPKSYTDEELHIGGPYGAHHAHSRPAIESVQKLMF